MPTPLIIHATHLRALLICERQLWLDAHGDRSQQNALPAGRVMRMGRGVRHEAAVHAQTAPHAHRIPAAGWADGIRLTQQAMAAGAPAILGGYYEAPLLLDGIDRPILVRGRIDRAVRLTRSLAGRTDAVYVPIEIKAYQQLHDSDRLQLDCYVWLLQQIQRRELPAAAFWLGEDGDIEQHAHLYDEERLLAALERAAHLLHGGADEPPVHLIPYCRSCRWNDLCRRQAQVRHDVSLLNGLHREARAHFAAAGITALSQIAALSLEEICQFRYIGPKTGPRLIAQAQAFVSAQPVWYGALTPICQTPGWFFDIETDPFTGTVWSIGWGDAHGDTQVALLAPAARTITPLPLPDGQTILLAPDADALWRCFADAVGIDSRPILHWTGFDAGVMHKSAPSDVTERLRGRLHDLNRSVNAAVQFPVRGTSLKTIAAYLGFGWSAYDDWQRAWTDYQRWLLDDDPAHVAAACAYQADDVRAMVVVWRWLNRR